MLYLITFARKYIANYTGLPKSCWKGIILICINAFTIGICFFLSLYFVKVQHLTTSTTGLLLSCYGLGTVIGGVVSGKLSDLIPPRYISISSLLMQSAAFFLLIYLQSSFALMLNLFLLGFSSYGFKTSNNISILRTCGEDTNLRYRTISISHVASNFGLGLSGVLFAGIVSYGFNFIFYLSGVVLLISATYLLFQKNTCSLIPLQVNEKNPVNQKNQPQVILLVLICIFLVGLIIAQLGSTYPLYIQESFPSFGVQAVSILFLLDTFIIVLFQAPLTVLISNQNKLLVTGFGALLMGFGMLILSYSSVFALAIFSCLIWTTGEMLFISTAQLICYENSNHNKKGRNFGLFQTVFAASNVVGPTLGGIIYQCWGGNLLWYWSAIIGAFCFIFCWYFSRSNANTTS